MKNNYPCKCGHLIENHEVVDVEYGGYYRDLEDGEGGHSYEPQYKSVFICSTCDSECGFELMNNLEYLEWKYDTNRNQ